MEYLPLNGAIVWLIRIITEEEIIRMATAPITIEEGEAVFTYDNIVRLGKLVWSFDPSKGGIAHVGAFSLAFASPRRDLWNKTIEVYVGRDPTTLDETLLLFQGIIQKVHWESGVIRITAYDSNNLALKQDIGVVLTRADKPGLLSEQLRINVPFGRDIIVDAAIVEVYDTGMISLQVAPDNWNIGYIKKFIVREGGYVGFPPSTQNNNIGYLIPNASGIIRVDDLSTIPANTAAVNLDVENTFLRLETDSQTVSSDFLIHKELGEGASILRLLIKAISNVTDEDSHELWMKWKRASDTDWIEEKFITDFRSGLNPQVLDTWNWSGGLPPDPTNEYALSDIGDSVLRLEFRGNNSANMRHVDIYGVAVGIDKFYKLLPRDKWYALVDGVQYGDWAELSGTIDKPAGVIEAILRAIGQEIDKDTFSAIYDRPWKCRGVAFNAYETLERILQEFSLVLFLSAGIWHLVKLGGHSPPIRILSTNDLLSPERFRYLPPICSSVALLYNFDPLTGEYLNIKQYGLASDGENLKIRSYWIYDEATALYAAAARAYNQCQGHWIVEFELPLSFLGLKLGDFIQLPSGIIGQIFYMGIEQDNIKLKIIQAYDSFES